MKRAKPTPPAAVRHLLAALVDVAGLPATLDALAWVVAEARDNHADATRSTAYDTLHRVSVALDRAAAEVAS